MNTSNVILAAKANSGKSTNNVWVVYTSDNSSDKMYCTSAYKAMRLAFLLKKRLGLNISDNCLARLSQEIAKGGCVIIDYGHLWCTLLLYIV